MGKKRVLGIKLGCGVSCGDRNATQQWLKQRRDEFLSDLKIEASMAALLGEVVRSASFSNFTASLSGILSSAHDPRRLTVISTFLPVGRGRGRCEHTLFLRVSSTIRVPSIRIT